MFRVIIIRETSRERRVRILRRRRDLGFKRVTTIAQVIAAVLLILSKPKEKA